MNQQLVEHTPHFQQPLRRLLSQNFLRRPSSILLPIRSRHAIQVARALLRAREERVGGGNGLEGGVLGVEGFEGEEGATEVALRDAGEEGGDVVGEDEAFLLGSVGEDFADL